MLNETTAYDLIQQHIPLGQQSGSGWYAVRCQVCNDHSPRGGILREGNTTTYNCFNCGTSAKHTDGTPLSKKFKNILERFGVPRDAIREVTSGLFLNKLETEEITFESLTKLKLHTPEVSLPPGCLPLLSTEHEDMQGPLLTYLLGRKIDPTRTPFMFSTDSHYASRIIIPYYRDGKVIYWQARHINSEVKPRYLNCTVAKDAVMYGYDRLYEYNTAPLFVTEGVFNAVMVNGLAITASTLNAAKIEVLKTTRRRLIFVRDRDANGDKLSEQVLENGWEITTVDPRVNDVNDSVKRFGLPYTAYSLIKNAQRPENKLSSKINLGIWGLEDRLRSGKVKKRR